MMYRTRRAMYRAAGIWYRRYHDFKPPTPRIHEKSTRSEIIASARHVLRDMRSREACCRSINQPFPQFERRHALHEIATYRRAASTRHDPDTTETVFYVSIINGTQYGLLYGPFPTQRLAIANLEIARAKALEISHVDAVFAAFGTCSRSAKNAPAGILNRYLPTIEQTIPVEIAC